MKFHIVRNNESVEEILFLYNLNKEELINNNKHIKVWERLVPGTKLKIPAIAEADELEVAQMEPFIEDYYPKMESFDFSTPEVTKTEDIPHVNLSEKNEEVVEKETSTEEVEPYPYYYPFYGYYRYPYYPGYFYQPPEEE